MVPDASVDDNSSSISSHHLFIETDLIERETDDAIDEELREFEIGMRFLGQRSKGHTTGS